MRFGIIAAAAVALVCAGQASAARYYEFQLKGSSTYAPDAVTKPVQYESTFTFAFDTQNISSNGVLASGNGYAIRLQIAPGATMGRLDTLTMPGGPLFNFTFDLGSVALGNALFAIQPSNTLFGLRIQPDARYSYTFDTTQGGIVSLSARTSDGPPLTLGATGVTTATTVPEPASWAMMILGMGAIGFAARRRKHRHDGYVIGAA